MPVLVLAVVNDHNEVEKILKAAPLSVAMATIEVPEESARTYPFESLLELYVRPAATAVVRAWRGNR